MIIKAALESDIDGILRFAGSKSLLQPVHCGTFLWICYLLAQNGVFVAADEGAIVGYAFAGSWDYFSQWPIFPFMVLCFPQLVFQGVAIRGCLKSFMYHQS
jgi:hypothetical protein